jgi:hypothetical protein
MKTFAALAAALLVLICAADISAQRRQRYGRVCGDPTAKCARGWNPHDMPFDAGRNAVIAESELFYLVILKSLKYDFGSQCDAAFPESDRVAAQALFPHNKVVAQRCSDPGEAYYTGVTGNVAFMGVYAGKTQAAARGFLEKVKATGKFPGAYIRRTRTGINGT